jgi:hypothetical protein
MLRCILSPFLAGGFDGHFSWGSNSPSKALSEAPSTTERRSRSKGRMRRPAIAASALAATIITGASAQSIQEVYVLNYYDYRQPDFVFTGNSVPTLYQSLGGAFEPNPFPPSWGANPTFAQQQAFGNSTAITAVQNGVSLSVPYGNSPGLPYEFDAFQLYQPGFSGSWNLTVSNPGYPVAKFQTNSIPSDIPTKIPFISNVQITGSTPNATISWVQPAFSVPADAKRESNFLITDMATKQVIDFFILPSTQTSFDLSTLGTTVDAAGAPSIPLVPGRKYQISVESTLSSPDDAFEYATSRNFVDFKPTSAPSPVSGPIYLPNVAVPSPNSVVYTFNIDVTEGQSYNIDPTTAAGFIYQIGAGDPNFASVDLPNIGNPNPYELLLWNGTKFVFDGYLDPDTVFDFAAGGVSEFEILGIAPSANVQLLSGTDFVTRVTFAGSGTFTGTVTSVVVPETSTWAMMLLGFAGLGYAGYRRARRGARRITNAARGRTLPPDYFTWAQIAE